MTRISKLPFVIGIALTLLLVVMTRVAFKSGALPQLAFTRALYLFAALQVIFLYYKAWGAIQDGYARTTPGKVLGFSFIPVFNIYWVFVVMAGFASDYNAYLERHKIETEKTLGSAIYWIAAFCWIFAFPTMGRPLGGILLFVLLVTQVIGTIKLIDAVNLLGEPTDEKPLDDEEPEAAGEEGNLENT